MIEVFGDVTCPFTYASLVWLARQRDRAGVRERIHVKAWPLELVNGVPLDSVLVRDEIAALRANVAPDLFHGFDPQTWPTTSLPALALAVAAYRVSEVVGERISLALRHALFEEGIDISAPDVLANIAEREGVPTGKVDPAAAIAEWHEGERRGVQGSPYFFAGGEGFFCPSLEIRHVDGKIVVTSDELERDRFLRTVFDRAGAP